MSNPLKSLLERTTESVTCLGCGCLCDDIAVSTRNGSITTAQNACRLGTRWFGDGRLPSRVRSSSGEGAGVDSAITEAASLLSLAQRPLIYLAADISCEVQRAAAGIADLTRAFLDTTTSGAATGMIAASQRLGRATATLGEIRNRADTVVFWGVDTASSHPRYAERCAPDPVGLHLPRGRQYRRVITVEISGKKDATRGELTSASAIKADRSYLFHESEEVTALSLLRTACKAVTGDANASRTLSQRPLPENVADLAGELSAGRYIVIVTNAGADSSRDRLRADALIMLTEALNSRARAALAPLRAGGNQSGADAVLTWQTGFPMAVDFHRGSPFYDPECDASARLARSEFDVALIVGNSASVPDDVRRGLQRGVSTIVVGPRASRADFPAVVAIDCGIAGVHERGNAIRMDDVMLPLTPALENRGVAEWHNAAARAGAGRLHNSINTARALHDAGLPQDSFIVLDALTASIAARGAR